jgi:hypothetical protein
LGQINGWANIASNKTLPRSAGRPVRLVYIKPIGFADSKLILTSECQLNDKNLLGWSLELFFNLKLHESSDVLIVLIISYYVHISTPQAASGGNCNGQTDEIK